MPTARAARQGWRQQKQISPDSYANGVPENIYMTHLYDKIVTITQNDKPVKRQYEWKTTKQLVDTVVQGWLESASHRGIMLSPRYERQGIGVAIAGEQMFVTEDLF